MKFINSKNKYKSIYNLSEENEKNLSEKLNKSVKFQSLPEFQKKENILYDFGWNDYATIPFTYSVVTKKDLLPSYVDIILESPELNIPDNFIPFVTVNSIFKSIPNTIITPLAEYQTSIWRQLNKITADNRELYRNDENGIYYDDTSPEWIASIDDLLWRFLYLPEIDEITVVFPDEYRPSNIYWHFNIGGYPKKITSGTRIQFSTSQNITFWKVKDNTYIIKYRTKIYCLQRAEKAIWSNFRVEDDIWTKDSEDELLYTRTSTDHETIKKYRYETESANIQVKTEIIFNNPLSSTKSIYTNDKI